MNSTQQQIDSDLMTAFKSKDTFGTSVLRMLKSTIKNAEIAKKAKLSDDEVLKILQKEIKQRKDAIVQYNQGGRADLASKEESEIALLEKYLPEQLSSEELEAIVRQAVEETGAKSKADFGKVMAKIMPQVAGKADGGEISKIVSSLLSND